MAKDKFLQIRLTPEQRERIRRAAEAEHLDVSTWARRVLLRTLEDQEPMGGLEGTRKIASKAIDGKPDLRPRDATDEDR